MIMNAPLIARNPATGAEIGRVPTTASDEVAAIVENARAVQAGWAAIGVKERTRCLKRWCQILAREADAWADLIREEIGKPRGEAIAGDVIAALDGIRWTVRQARRTLADASIDPGWQRLLQIPTARVRYRPLGVIGVIGTWNYPIFLNAPVIAQALAAGNAVVWKPSELATLTGRKLQDSLDASGMPSGIVSAVFGGPDVGRALCDANIDKGVFTGGVENGRRVLRALAERGIPAVAELSGFDPAIILPDAPVESTARSIAWGAFVSAGQTCVAVKRVYIVGDASPWIKAIAEVARSLRIGDPAGSDVDLGPMISASARDRFQATIQAAVSAGAEVVTGGAPRPGPGFFYPPTVLRAETPSAEAALAGVFGPVVIVRGLPDVASALAAANASPYGLAASVWSGNLRAGRLLAGQLNAGMVLVNEIVTPTMHASAPFGGTRASGFGRTHGPFGLREFVQTQTLYQRRAGGFRPHLFPYGGRQVDVFLQLYRRFVHGA